MIAPSLSTANRPDKPEKLMDQVRDVLRIRHYSLRTEHDDSYARAEPAGNRSEESTRLMIVIGLSEPT